MQSDFDFFYDIRRRLLEGRRLPRKPVAAGKSSEAFSGKPGLPGLRHQEIPYETGANPHVRVFHSVSQFLRWFEAYMSENASGLLAGQGFAPGTQRFAQLKRLRPGKIFHRENTLFNRPADRMTFFEELELFARRKRTLYNKRYHF